MPADLDDLVWRVVTRSKKDHIAHLIPADLTHGQRTLCNEAVDPFYAKHSGTVKCFKCARIARENQEDS